MVELLDGIYLSIGMCDPHELRSISSHLQLHVRPTFNLFPCTICLLYKVIMGGCRHKVL